MAAIVGASARVSGTPTAAGTFTFTVTATDTQSATGSRTYTVTIAPAAVTIVVAPVSLPNGVLGIGYSETITAVGGTGPYTFAATAGPLPAGLSLNAATGVLSGTPTTAGVSNFTITATDTTSAAGNRAYALTITATPTPQISLSPRALPDGTVGAAYTQTLTALGGVGPPYTQSITAGALPPGLSFTAGPGERDPVGRGHLHLHRDGDRCGDKQRESGLYRRDRGTTPTPTPITISPTDVPNGTIGVPYSQRLSASGGAGGPYTFAVTGGSLPAGLSLGAAGLISGTPTTGRAVRFCRDSD